MCMRVTLSYPLPCCSRPLRLRAGSSFVPSNNFVSAIQVSLFGGQVTSWRNEKGEELLFTSSKVLNIRTMWLVICG